jgi:hypothetical protein
MDKESLCLSCYNAIETTVVFKHKGLQGQEGKK